MSVCLKRNGPLLKLLSNSPPCLRRAILDAAPNDLIKGISEISLNILKGVIPLAARQKAVMRKKRSLLKSLSRSKTPLTKKKRLVKQSGGFIGSLLGFAVPLVASLLTPS